MQAGVHPEGHGVCRYICVPACIFIDVHMYAYISVHMLTCTYMSVHAYICMHIARRAYIRIRVCDTHIFIHMQAYAQIGMHRHTHK